MEETCIEGSHIKWKQRLLPDKIGPWGGDLRDVQKNRHFVASNHSLPGKYFLTQSF